MSQFDSNPKQTAPAHRYCLRVYYEDTDFSGVVYHASYLRFMERGRTEWLRERGVFHNALFEKADNLAFAVRAVKIDYLKPALMDDWLTVETRTLSAAGASAWLQQNVLRDGERLATAEVRIVAMRKGRAVRLPPGLF